MGIGFINAELKQLRQPPIHADKILPLRWLAMPGLLAQATGGAAWPAQIVQHDTAWRE